MNLSLEKEFSKAEIFERIDELKNQIDTLRPLSAEIEGRVMQKLRLDWNYNSNAIEGNKLNYGETTALLMHGVTAKGKPLKDHLDIQGHNAAIDLLLQMVQDERPLSETDIRGLHEVILGEPHTVAAQTADGTPTTKLLKSGEYKKLPNHVKTRTGEIHYYATPEETPAKMNDLMQWYSTVIEDKSIHPIVIAALFHHRFVAIHPFDDGNGRMTRILMNLILMHSGYPVAVIKNDDKDNYYSLLSRADVGDLWPFIEYIAERVESSLLIYKRATSGEDIEDESDIEKELKLFQIELKSHINISEKRSDKVVQKVFSEFLISMLNDVAKKASIFDEFFFSWRKSIRVYYNTGESDYDFFHLPVDENYFDSYFKSIFKVEFLLHFEGFKSEANSFQFTLTYSVFFEEYRYVIFQDSEMLLSNRYDLKVSSEARQVFIRNVLKRIKDIIKFSLE